MAESNEQADLQRWHKRFAAESNNRAWALSVQPRSGAQDREMLDAAHASAWHWAQIGTELNRMRATMLVAQVHALLGMGASSFALAETMREYFVAREETPDWEIACAHAVHAQAAHAAGRAAEHHAAYARAAEALASITDEEDRRIIAKTFDRVPRP